MANLAAGTVLALAAIVRISVAEDRNKGRTLVKFNRGLRSAQENRRRCKGRSMISARLKQKAGLEVMPLIEAMARRPKTSPSAGKPVSATVGHRIFPGHLAAEGLRRSVKVVVVDLSMSVAAEAAEDMSAAAEAAEDMSVAAEVAVAVGAAADAVPTFASRKTSPR
jgi:hypothetical protein